MKKELVLAVISIIAVGIFMTGCAQPATKYFVCTDGRQVLDANQCALPTPPKEEPSPPPVFTEPEPENVKIILTDSAKALFDKAAKVNSLQFYYVESPNTMPESHYYMSKQKMKIELMTKAKFDVYTYYDTVYLDLVNKQGIGYCEERSGLCPDNNRIFDVNYSKYLIITPFEWLSRITWADTTGKSKLIDNRNAVEVSFKIKDNPGTMFMDSFFGIPMYVTYNNKIFEYRDLAINLVNESTLVHQII
jgi:hypothetical protein